EATAESHIITLDSAMPAPLQGVIWQAISTPLGAPYMPLFATMDDVPSGYTAGSNEYGPLSAYWAFRGLHALANSQGAVEIAEMAALWRDYENGCLQEHGAIKAMLRAMYRDAPESALRFSKRYSIGIAYETVGLAQRKRSQLMTKIAEAYWPVHAQGAA